jgi:putative oxidoreductase
MITETQVRSRTANAYAQPTRFRRAALAFFSTPHDFTGLILRLALAIGMFPHGAQKVLGWYGGFGFSKTLGMFTQNGMPAPLALAVISAEFFGPIALVFGFFTRWSAFGIGLVMAGAALMVHSSNGFFMNWMGNQKGEGIEYFIPVIAIALALIVKGAGAWSADRAIARKLGADLS